MERNSRIFPWARIYIPHDMRSRPVKRAAKVPYRAVPTLVDCARFKAFPVIFPQDYR